MSQENNFNNAANLLTGTNTNATKQNGGKYVFDKPNDSLLSTLFPSYYHSLTDFDNRELLSTINLINDQYKDNEAERTIQLDNVKNIIIDSFSRKPMAICYWTAIVIVLAIIVMIILHVKNVEYGNLFYFIFGGCTLFFIYNFVVAKVFAESEGKIFWNDLINRQMGLSATGYNNVAALDQLSQQNTTNTQYNNSYNNSTAINAGSFFGSMINSVLANSNKK